MRLKPIARGLALAGLLSTFIIPAYADVSHKDATSSTKNANDQLYNQLPR